MGLFEMAEAIEVPPPPTPTDAPKAFVKRTGAHFTGDHETWDEAEVSRPILGGELATHSGASGALAREPQPGAIRRLTPTECERLQSFPDGWTAIPYAGKATPSPRPPAKPQERKATKDGRGDRGLEPTARIAHPELAKTFRDPLE